MALWETDSVLETETGKNSVFTPPQGMAAKPLRTLKHKGFTLYFFIWDESVCLSKMAGVPGIEPGIAGSKPDALPLGHTPTM